MRSLIQKVSGIALLVAGVGITCVAQSPAPEIDRSTGLNALVLVAGALMIMRSRRR
jgi:hypothetical protein